jgi:hypothetical protein
MQEPQEKRKSAGENSFLPSSKGLVLRSKGAPHSLTCTHCYGDVLCGAVGLKACLIPAGAMIIAFRGTEAFNLLNWCADSAEGAARCSAVQYSPPHQVSEIHF